MQVSQGRQQRGRRAVATIVCRDFPKPDFESTKPFQEMQDASQWLKDAPRPQRPLKVVIVGAGLAGLSTAK